MQQLSEIKIYIDSVCEQVRWKKAHSFISEELESHIIDQKNAFISDGLNEEIATEKSICEMGDPVIVGTQFDRTHRPKIEWSMITLTIFLLITGFLFRFFISINSRDIYYSHSFRISIMYVVIGIVFMIIAYLVDFTILGKYPKAIFVIWTAFMIVALPFTVTVNGARHWLRIPFLGSFSTSIFMLSFPTMFAGIIYSMRNKGYLGIIMCGVFYVIPAFIFTTMGYGITSVFIYSLACFILLAIGILKSWFNVKRFYGMMVLIVPAVILSVIFLLSMFSESYRLARFEAWLNPYIDPYGRGYMAITIRDILSCAKFFGKGTFPINYTDDGTIWFRYMEIDYLITCLIHNIGWVAFIFILLIFMTFIVRGFYLCSKQKSVLGILVSTSVLLTFTIQAFIYIMANLGFQLFSPLTLPLIS